MIRIYIHYASLKNFQNGDWVNGRFQFMGQNDIELLLPIKDIITAYQSNGFTVRKKKWYEKLFNIKAIK